MKIITVNNQKGGVGKTTIALHIAYAAAKRGNRVMQTVWALPRTYGVEISWRY